MFARVGLVLCALCINTHLLPFYIHVYMIFLYSVYGRDLCFLGHPLICYIAIHFLIGVLHASVTTVVCMDLHVHACGLSKAMFSYIFSLK